MMYLASAPHGFPDRWRGKRDEGGGMRDEEEEPCWSSVFLFFIPHPFAAALILLTMARYEA
jgi:hypothetical protein